MKTIKVKEIQNKFIVIMNLFYDSYQNNFRYICAEMDSYVKTIHIYWNDSIFSRIFLANSQFHHIFHF